MGVGFNFCSLIPLIPTHWTFLVQSCFLVWWCAFLLYFFLVDLAEKRGGKEKVHRVWSWMASVVLVHWVQADLVTKAQPCRAEFFCFFFLDKETGRMKPAEEKYLEKSGEPSPAEKRRHLKNWKHCSERLNQLKSTGQSYFKEMCN